MLPGVPSLFRHQLETVLKRLPFTRVYLKCLYLSAREAEVAPALDAVALSMPHVAIGSYPNFDQALDYAVKVTVEHAEADPVEQALARLYRALRSEWILRVE
jgi:molybdopterin-biosynthesis enzyme MoeA-like protein